MFDPSQQQGPLLVPGIPGAQESMGGPLADLQDQVAAVLNGNGDRPNIYVPGGPGEPVFQVPNVRTAIASVVRFLRRS